METTQIHSDGIPTATAMTRTIVFSYSLLAYLIGMAAIAWLVACLAGLLPLGAAPWQASSQAVAMLANLGLLVLFGLQHSVMARPGFKQWWTRLVPQPAERSSYVFASGITLALLLWLWQPVNGVVWSQSSPDIILVLWILFAIGWLYLVAATFVTNHFDLFGLRQGWLFLRGKACTPVPFTRNWMYRYSRHPMMAGILVGLWATPHMTLTHLLLAAGFSLYIVIGVSFEERELLARFGDKYQRYRRQVGMLMPRLRNS